MFDLPKIVYVVPLGRTGTFRTAAAPVAAFVVPVTVKFQGAPPQGPALTVTVAPLQAIPERVTWTLRAAVGALVKRERVRERRWGYASGTFSVFDVSGSCVAGSYS